MQRVILVAAILIIFLCWLGAHSDSLPPQGTTEGLPAPSPVPSGPTVSSSAVPATVRPRVKSLPPAAAEVAEALERLQWTGNCANCNFRGANLAGVQLVVLTPPQEADLFQERTAQIGVNLENADLSQTVLDKANLSRAYLRRADLRGASLQQANLNQAVLRKANLQGANLEAAKLVNTVLAEADLTGANLTGAVIREANFQGAILSQAILKGLALKDGNFTGANFRATDLTQAQLRGANLSGSDLRGGDPASTGAGYG